MIVTRGIAVLKRDDARVVVPDLQVSVGVNGPSVIWRIRAVKAYLAASIAF